MARRTASLVFLFFALTYVLTNAFRESVQLPDEEYVLLVTSNMVEGRPLHLPPDVPLYPGAAYVGKDGKPYSVYQIGSSLLYAPFYFTAKHVLAFSEPYAPEKHGRDKRDYHIWLERQTRRYLSLCPIFFAALSCAVFFLFAHRLGGNQTTSLILTLFYGLGTMVWPYSKYLLTESFQNALLLSSVYLLFAQRQEGSFRPAPMALAGALFGLLLSIRAPFVILLPVLIAYWFYRNRDRRLMAPLLCFCVPVVALFVPQFLYDHVRFQNALSLGYGTAGFSTPIWVGLYGYLFSSGKSFFLYAPVAILFFLGIREFFRDARTEALLFLLIIAIVPLKYASWWVWSGDPAWGPRYLLVLTPYVLLPAVGWLERRIARSSLWPRAALGGLLGVSVLIQLLAVSVHYLYYYNYVRNYGSLIPASHLSVSPRTETGQIPIRDRFLETEFNPEYSPILGQWWMVRSLLTEASEPGLSAPWAGLGYAKLHAGAPLKARWDLWLVELVQHGLTWRNMRVILGAFALLVFFTIVAEELLRTIWVRGPGS